MATMIPVSEDNPALSVVRYASEISWADAGVEVVEEQVSKLCLEAEECMLMGRWLDLASLMLAAADVILSNPKVSEKDLDCIFTVICDLVTKCESPDEAHELAKLICAKVIQQPNDKPVLRLKILFNLYNLSKSGRSRFYIYIKALSFAVSGKISEHVLPSLKKVDCLLKEWNIDVKEQRELFLCVSNVLKESKSFSVTKDFFKFLTKYLETFNGEDASVLGEAKEEAVLAIIEFVKSPDMFQCDLLDMPAVAQLEKDPECLPFHHLLKIFSTQKLDSYLEFQAANSELLCSYGLVHDDCVTKMRLVTLADLAATESGRISFHLIKNELQVGDDEVETWVVNAVTAKLIDCQIDQVNQVVLVSNYPERLFGELQWHELREKLASWRENIEDVLNTIQVSKIVDDGSLSMQALMIHHKTETVDWATGGRWR